MSNRHDFENSSSLKHMDYDEEKQRLEICFHNGNVYHYNCHKGEYDDLKCAKSPGSHFQTHIRGKYKHVGAK